MNIEKHIVWDSTGVALCGLKASFEPFKYDRQFFLCVDCIVVARKYQPNEGTKICRVKEEKETNDDRR